MVGMRLAVPTNGPQGSWVRTFLRQSPARWPAQILRHLTFCFSMVASADV